VSAASNAVVGDAVAGSNFGKGESKGYQAQSNPYAAPPETGTVVLENPTGREVHVFVDGMLLAKFGKGQLGPSTQKVGTGIVRIDWYDPATHTRVAGGMLSVEKDKRVGLSLGATAVEAKDRPWSYAPEP
jgi:hypothetical protein